MVGRAARFTAAGVFALGMVAASAGTASADDQHGNKGAVWSLHTEDGWFCEPDAADCLQSGNDWGPLIKMWTQSDAHDEGSGVSEGVHFAKDNGPKDK